MADLAFAAANVKDKFTYLLPTGTPDVWVMKLVQEQEPLYMKARIEDIMMSLIYKVQPMDFTTNR